jgi:hypothetical protein
VSTYRVRGWCKTTGEMMECAVDAETITDAKRHAESQGLSFVVVTGMGPRQAPGRHSQHPPPDDARSDCPPGRAESSSRLRRIEQALDSERRGAERQGPPKATGPQ